jgi:hypothetical protein
MNDEHEASEEIEAHELPAEGATLAELLDTPISRSEPAADDAPTCMLGECVDARHPSLQGRVLVRFTTRGGAQLERWVPTLQGLPVRVADRVMMLRPANASEWVVTGVVDGFATRPRVEKSEAARVELQRDEAVRVVSSEGAPLVEISQSDAGPVVRVLESNVNVEFAGKLALEAEDIQLRATKGEVSVEASADVVVKGETIQLN